MSLSVNEFDAELLSCGLANLSISTSLIKQLHQRCGTVSDKSDRATVELVLDPKTRMLVFKIINKGLFDELQGCISAGKEANVYCAHRRSDDVFFAVKIYKTSILIFKDREKYVVGEFRFRHGYNKSNPRKMVQLWAEKELRNLKRIRLSGINCPEPILLKSHVLLMQFLGDSNVLYVCIAWLTFSPSPTLKNAVIESAGIAFKLYVDLIVIVRTLFQTCKLVHADLSEYNILYHQKALWVIDVGQAVEHDHPYALEFLRKDCLNINTYFKKYVSKILPLRSIFDFVVQPLPVATEKDPQAIRKILTNQMSTMSQLSLSYQEEMDERVFLEAYIPRTLNEIVDIERDIDKLNSGNTEDLLYCNMTSINHMPEGQGASTASETIEHVCDEAFASAADPVTESEPHTKRVAQNLKKSKEEKQQHKKLVKAENRLRRQSKMKKSEKKRLCKSKSC